MLITIATYQVTDYPVVQFDDVGASTMPYGEARGAKRRLLSGATLVDDRGFSQGDRNFNIRGKITQIQAASLRGMRASNSLIWLSTDEGAFTGHIRNLDISNGQLDMLFWPTGSYLASNIEYPIVYPYPYPCVFTEITVPYVTPYTESGTITIDWLCMSDNTYSGGGESPEVYDHHSIFWVFLSTGYDTLFFEVDSIGASDTGILYVMAGKTKEYSVGDGSYLADGVGHISGSHSVEPGWYTIELTDDDISSSTGAYDVEFWLIGGA